MEPILEDTSPPMEPTLEGSQLVKVQTHEDGQLVKVQACNLNIQIGNQTWPTRELSNSKWPAKEEGTTPPNHFKPLPPSSPHFV